MATLADLARQYLAQALPDISGIFKPRVDTPVEETPVEETISGVTPQLLQSTGRGGDDFSVYNPDPTKVRTDYRPYDYNKAMRDPNFPGVAPNPNLYYPESDLSGLLNVVPFVGPIKRGVEFVGGILDPYLPVNQRSIMENEARGMGILTDDIGRIVQGSGDYNTGANVMAGYNLSQVTPETIQKRRDRILKTMSKPGYSGNLQDRLDALDEFEEMMFGTTGVKAKTNTIVDAKKKEKDPTYKTLDELVAAGLAEGDDDDDENQEFLDFLKAINPKATPTGITAASFPGIGFVDTQDTIKRINRARDRDRGVDVDKNIKTINKIDFSGMNVGGGGDGPQNISTSGGSIGDRVSSSYRDDPDTGLL